MTDYFIIEWTGDYPPANQRNWGELWANAIDAMKMAERVMLDKKLSSPGLEIPKDYYITVGENHTGMPVAMLNRTGKWTFEDFKLELEWKYGIK